MEFGHGANLIAQATVFYISNKMQVVLKTN